MQASSPEDDIPERQDIDLPASKRALDNWPRQAWLAHGFRGVDMAVSLKSGLGDLYVLVIQDDLVGSCRRPRLEDVSK